MEALRKFFSTVWPTVIKYLFSVAIALFAFSRVPNPVILVVTLFEIALVFVLCNELARVSRLAATITSGILLLLMDVQLFVLVFSNTFATLVMLTNLDSLEDLSGKMLVYGAAVLFVLAIVCLPVRHVELRVPRWLVRFGGLAGVLFVLVSAELVALEVNGASSSPLFAYADLAYQQAENAQAEEEMKKQPNTTLEFYHPDVPNWRTRPEQLPERPNVVLIFTEGLSQNIVDDEREIMPNVARYQRESLTFSSYFNHTFATYRGLIGQLYSGYQYSNYDTNTLVSLPAVLRDLGYQSAFINVEGYNEDFSAYLTTLGFDEVINCHDPEKQGPVGDGYSDRLAYDELMNQMEARANTGQPFLLSIYTFGTHASFDSADEKFGDGDDSELNKFYDADYQFGQFMDRFRESPLLDNTVIVFTTDHCTYADMYFSQAFPDFLRTHMELDPIPLFFYYKDVEPEVIDVNGRNSLDLAPTVLDLLDMSGVNYFLGTSLFAPNEQASVYETYFTDGTASAMRTTDGVIEPASGAEAKEIKRLVWRYYAAKRQEPLTPDQVNATALDAVLEAQEASRDESDTGEPTSVEEQQADGDSPEGDE